MTESNKQIRKEGKVNFDLEYTLTLNGCFKHYPEQAIHGFFGTIINDEKTVPTMKFFKCLALSSLILGGIYTINSTINSYMSNPKQELVKKIINKESINKKALVSEFNSNYKESIKVNNSSNEIESVVYQPEFEEFNPNLKYQERPVFVDMDNDGDLEEYLVKVEDHNNNYGTKFYFNEVGKQISINQKNKLENKLDEIFNLYTANPEKLKNYFNKYSKLEKDEILTSIIEKKALSGEYSNDSIMFGEYNLLASIIGL